MHTLNSYKYIISHKWGDNTHPVFVIAIHLTVNKGEVERTTNETEKEKPGYFMRIGRIVSRMTRIELLLKME